jgi:hypothetical protein
MSNLAKEYHFAPAGSKAAAGQENQPILPAGLQAGQPGDDGVRALTAPIARRRRFRAAANAKTP